MIKPGSPRPSGVTSLLKVKWLWALMTSAECLMAAVGSCLNWGCNQLTARWHMRDHLTPGAQLFLEQVGSVIAFASPS